MCAGCGFNFRKENQKDCEESLVCANCLPFNYLIIIIYLVGKVKIYKGKMKKGKNEKSKRG